MLWNSLSQNSLGVVLLLVISLRWATFFFSNLQPLLSFDTDLSFIPDFISVTRVIFSQSYVASESRFFSLYWMSFLRKAIQPLFVDAIENFHRIYTKVEQG